MLSIGGPNATGIDSAFNSLQSVSPDHRTATSSHLDYAKSLSSTSTHTQILSDYKMSCADPPKVQEDPSQGNMSAVDSGIDLISPTPGLHLQPTSCPRAVKSPATFKASVALDLDRIPVSPSTSQTVTSSLFSSPSTMSQLTLNSKATSSTTNQDLARKRRLSESATSSNNKVHISSQWTFYDMFVVKCCLLVYVDYKMWLLRWQCDWD